MSSIETSPPKAAGPVVVAGFGGAGAAAAVAAAQAGAEVLVFDRAPAERRGGNTRRNLFYMLMKDDQHLTDSFVPDLKARTASPVSHFGEGAETASVWGVDESMLRTWIDDAVPTVDWIREVGVQLSKQESDIVAHGAAAGIMPDGGGDGLLQLMEAKARELGAVFTYETTVVGVRTSDTGEITHVLVESPEGRRLQPCSALILATGGYHGNLELSTRYLGPRAGYLVPLSREGYYNQGEGLRIGLELGAGTAGDLGDYHAVAVDARADGERWLLTGYKYGILVNRAGRRFVDEGSGEDAVKAIPGQKDGVAFAILDRRASQSPFYKNSFNSDAGPLRADSLEKLADLIDVPAAVLWKTVQEYNAACDVTTTDDSAATTGLDIDKSRLATPLTEGPYEAWPVKAGNTFALAGLKVDGDGRVLSVDGRPLPGLYAAGDTVGGYFKEYVTYTSTVKALVLGRRAGTHAAARAAS